MSNLTELSPTDIIRNTGSTTFYFGVWASSINDLPSDSEFSVVYSPRENWGWEFVRYRVFQDKNGLIVIERRELEDDEIAYFEHLGANKISSDTQK